MKQKTWGLISIFFLVTAVMAAGVYAVKGPWEQSSITLKRRPSNMPGLVAPPAPLMREMSELASQLSVLSKPSGRSPSPANLTLFGYNPNALRSIPKGIPQSQMARQVAFDYALTFTFTSAIKRFCVINGTFYDEGSTVAGGGIITKIEPQRVLVKKNNKLQWIILKTDSNETQLNSTQNISTREVQ